MDSLIPTCPKMNALIEMDTLEGDPQESDAIRIVLYVTGLMPVIEHQ